MVELTPKPLSQKEAEQLAARISKESKDTRVRIGTTNGRRCLHVRTVGSTRESRTIYGLAGWFEHPANHRAQTTRRAQREAAAEAAKTNEDIKITHA